MGRNVAGRTVDIFFDPNLSYYYKKKKTYDDDDEKSERKKNF
jgi:hypothetical protein